MEIPAAPPHQRKSAPPASAQTSPQKRLGGPTENPSRTAA